MVTWQGDTPRVWRLRLSPAVASDAAEHEHQPGSDQGGAAHPAEPGQSPDEPVPEHDAEEQRLADQRVVDAILGQGLQGPLHQQLDRGLIKYAVPVLRLLLRTGEIFTKCTRLRRPAGNSVAWLDFSDSDREELARDMVADALPIFTRAVFEQRRWSPAGGASLRTYFVNACVLQFPRLYHEWLSQRRAAIPAGLEIDPADGNRATDPAQMIIKRDEAARALQAIGDQRMQEVLARHAIGFGLGEAAESAGLTPKAAERRLARIRHNAKREANEAERLRSTQHDTRHGGRWEQ